MSTRCEILIKQEYKDGEKEQVKLYHHHDGYPEGVGYDLTNRAQKWFWDVEHISNSLVKDSTEEYEIATGYHTDIEYFYIIDVNLKTIKCYQAHYECSEHKCKLVLDEEEKI